MSLRAVLFDLDDTLLWDERSVQEALEATCQFAESEVNVPAASLLEAIRTEAKTLYSSYPTFPFTQMIGINPFEALWARFEGGELESFRELQRLVPEYRRGAWTAALRSVGVDNAELGEQLGERFAKERRARPFTYEETFEVLDALKGNYKLLLLTNGAPDLQKEKIASIEALDSYFDHIVISGEYGKGKPEPAIFQHAMELLGISPEEGVMIGDKLTTDILGSSRVGLRNIWINHHQAQQQGEVKPTFTVSRLRDILPIIESLT